MRKVAIIQARSGSSRFPEKIFANINGKTMLERVLQKIREAKQVDDVVVATTDLPSDQKVIDFCALHEINCFAGSEHDVLARYHFAAEKFGADCIIRVTADCPLFDALILDQGISVFGSKSYDYVTNVLPPSFPDGLDFSIFSREVLKQAFLEAELSSEREHVVPWIWKNCSLQGGKRYQAYNLTSDIDYSKIRWTVDYPSDLEIIEKIYTYFGEKKFSWKDVLTLNFDVKNKDAIVRDEGYLKSLREDFIVTKPSKK